MFAHVLLFCLITYSVNCEIRVINDYQLVIVGGSTPAFGVLLSAAKLINTNGCLLEQLRETPVDEGAGVAGAYAV